MQRTKSKEMLGKKKKRRHSVKVISPNPFEVKLERKEKEKDENINWVQNDDILEKGFLSSDILEKLAYFLLPIVYFIFIVIYFSIYLSLYN